MADSSTRIVITAEDRASAGLTKVGDSVKRLGESAGSLGALKTALGGLAGAFAGGALISFAKGAIDAADNINDLSQKVGISVKDLAGWQLAAEQSGTSLEAVGKGVKGLSKAMIENGAALKAAGVDAKDANGALIQLADLFKALPDGVEKTTLAFTLFGKAGMDMIPVINQGSKGLADAQAKAAKYAEKLAELAPKADEFNDKLKELEIAGKATTINALLPMMDGLIGLAAWFKDARSGAEGFGNALAFIGEKLSGDSVLRKWLTGGYLIEGAGNAIARMGAPGGGMTGQQILDRMDAQKAAGQMLPGANSAEEKAATDKARKLLAALGVKPAGGSGRSGKSDLERMLELGRKNELDAYYETGGEETQRIVAEKRAVDAAKEEYRERQKATEAAEQALRKYKDMIDPLQKYRVMLQEVAAIEGLTDDERLEALWKINEAMDAEIDKLNGVGEAAAKTKDFARDMGMTFASAFEDAVVGGKAFGDVLKGLAQDIERIIVRKTVTEPLGNAISDAIMGSTGLNDFFGNLFGGARAAGGPVAPGQFYVVGENGPEVLVPNTGGMVIPNGAAMGAAPSGDVNINFSVTAMDAGSFRNSMAANKAVVIGIVREAFTRRAITSPL